MRATLPKFALSLFIFFSLSHMEAAYAQLTCDEAIRFEPTEEQIWAKLEKSLQDRALNRNNRTAIREIFDERRLPVRTVAARLGPILQIREGLRVWNLQTKESVPPSSLLGQHVVMTTRARAGDQMSPPSVGQIVGVFRATQTLPDRLVIAPNVYSGYQPIEVIPVVVPYALRNTRPNLYDCDRNYVGRTVEVYYNQTIVDSGSELKHIRIGPLKGHVFSQAGYSISIEVGRGDIVSVRGISTVSDWVEVVVVK